MMKHPTKGKIINSRQLLFLMLCLVSFEFCSNKLIAQAPGISCLTAVALGVPTCTGAVTMSDFTVDPGTPAISCIGAGVFRREGWYTFTLGVPTAITVAGTSTTASSNLIIQVITVSPTCGVGFETQIACINNIAAAGAQTETGSLGILAAGTYYVRLINVGAAANMAMSNFCINLTPANDDCANAATIIPLGASLPCGATAGSTLGASPQASIPATCTAVNTNNDDVWYTFTATSTSHLITVAPTATMDVVFQVYSTNPCGGGGTSINCSNLVGAGVAESATLSGLTITNTYWVRVYDAATGIPASPTFTICIQTPPANDDCLGAIPLATNTSCITTTGNVNVASNSGIAACGSGSSNPDDDVWYSFTATCTSQTITVTGSPSFDPSFEVFSGTCGSLVSIICNAPGGQSGLSISSVASGLTIGTTYYIRVYDYASGYPPTTTFTICIVNAPPANDNCAAAIALAAPSVNCVTTTGDVCGATQSLAGCSGNANDDIWYSFVAGQTTQVVTVTGNGTFDPVFEVFASCGGASLGCYNATGAGGTESASIAGLSVATTYYVRVYDAGAGFPSNTTFTICVTSPPVNDGCGGAIVLAPLTTNCIANSNMQTGNDLAATQSLAGCSGNANDDLWYTFTTIGIANQPYIITAVGNGTFDPVIQVFSTSCGGISVSCINATGAGGTETVTLTAGVQLTINTQYWIRVYDAGAGYPSNNTFTICVTIPTPPPINDPCSGAIPLNAGYLCTATTGTVGGATPDGYAATCGGTPSDDVWYSFWPNSATATITIVGSAGFNPVIEVFQGSCGGTSVSCTNANGIGVGEVANLVGLQAFTQYFIRVYDFSGSPTTYNFAICITEPAVTASDCATAYSICSNFVFHITNTSNGAVADLPASGTLGNPFGCMGQLEQSPTWWLVNITGSGTLEFTLGVGMQASFYDWIMYPYNGNCAAIPANTVAPVRCNYNATTVGGTGIVSAVPAGGFAGNYSMPALPVVAGQQYVVMFNNWSHATANVPLVFGGTASISCVAPLPIELIYFNGKKQNDGTNLLTWASASETNNDYFLIKRSTDATNWDVIGRVEGAGNSSTEKDYQLIDKTPPAGINYYRLTQVDYNGMASQFDIITIDNSYGPAGKIIKITNMLGQDVPWDYEGLRVIFYSNGAVIKKMGR